MITTNVINDVTIVYVDFSFFGGSAMLEDTDPGIDKSKLPKDLVLYGTKKVIDIKHLTIFRNARKSVERMALLKGTKFLGGWAFTHENAQIFYEEVKVIIAQLKIDLQVFLANYPQLVDEWALKHTEWYDVIRAAAPSLSTVNSRFSFKVNKFRIQIPELGDDGGILEELAGLPNQILREIAKDVKVTWVDRGYGAQNIKSMFRRVKTKIQEVSLMMNNSNLLVEMIDEVVGLFPATGHIEGKVYLRLKDLVEFLMTPEKVLQTLTMASQGIQVEIFQEDADAIPAEANANADAIPAEANANADAIPAEANADDAVATIPAPITLPPGAEYSW